MAKKVSKEVEAILRPYNDDIKRHITGLAKKSDEDIKRYVGALSEDFQGKVSAIGEQFGGLNRKLDSHAEMIGKLAVDMEIVKTNVETIKGDLKKKVDYDEFLKLERRVSAIEAKNR